MNKTKSATFSYGLKGILGVFFLVSIVFPLIKMFTSLKPEQLKTFYSSERFVMALSNSFLISAAATILSIAVAGVLAWCITRTKIKFKNLWVLLLTLPMLIPSISHGISLIVLFGSNGILTKFFHLANDIYGFLGIVIGSILYTFPVAFLMISDVLKYEDACAYEAAEVLGISKFRQFTAITFPYLRRPLISVFFAVFTMIITDYGVPLMVGTPQTLTLPVMMFQDVVEGMDFSRGSMIGLVLLLPALAAFFIGLF